MSPVNRLTQSDLKHIDLSRLNSFSSFKGLATFDNEAATIFRAEQLTSTLEAGGLCWFLGSLASPQAVCSIKPLVWDSQHFGLPMGQMVIMSSPEAYDQQCRRLIRVALEEQSQLLRLRHLTTEVDIDHYTTLNALLSHSFEIMDLKQYLRCQTLKDIPIPNDISRVRQYHASDKSAVLHMAEEVRFKTRFSRDIYLSEEKTNKMYVLWLKKHIENKETTELTYTYIKDEKIIACASCGINSFTTSTNKKFTLAEKGLYLSNPPGQGANYAIAYSVFKSCLEKYNIIQPCVSLNNKIETSALEKIGAKAALFFYSLRIFIE